VELLCEAGRKTALSVMGAVSENVGVVSENVEAVSENVGAVPTHVFTACVTKVPNVDPLSSAGMQPVSCDMGAVSCDVGASSCYVLSIELNASPREGFSYYIDLVQLITWLSLCTAN
jgi:hypothetical protein